VTVAFLGLAIALAGAVAISLRLREAIVDSGAAS
jgi:hypothetical protein